MSTFAQAAATPSMTETTNGMAAYEHAGDKLVDLFFNIGASRNNPDITKTFVAAFGENPLLALKCLFYARDIRGGAGERKVFRNCIKLLENINPDAVKKNLHLIPVYGRWDDLLEFTTPVLQRAAYDLIFSALHAKDGLCAKWMPRKGPTANALRRHFKLVPKEYRRWIVDLSQTVEQLMCANNWSEIQYDKLPSVASARYQKAFNRHDTERYQKYKEALKAGTSTINAGALYPYDVLRSIKGGGDPQVALAQWEALPNYVGDSKILPVCDVSGSMSAPASGMLSCLDVCISLGIYLADKNKGVFKDVFCTFSSHPTLQVLSGNLLEKYNQLSSATWSMSTNLEAALKLILKKAVDNQVPQSEMPDAILILSDMQFDMATRDSSANPTALEMIKREYEKNGYKIPVVVFWNLNAAYGNTPATGKEKGTVLISGFSPSVLKNVLSMDFSKINPKQVVLETLNSSRYDAITI